MKRFFVLLTTVLLFGFNGSEHSSRFINNEWWLKYNDKVIISWDIEDTSIYEIETKKIKPADTIRFEYSGCGKFAGDHTTEIYLSTKSKRVLVSSNFSEIYPDGEGQFAVSRLKKISDSLKRRTLEVHVYLDTPRNKPWIVAILRLK